MEFKNPKVKNINVDNIKSKFKSGTIILKELLKNFEKPKDNKFIFCVVYKSSGKPKYFDYSHFVANLTKFSLDEENKHLNNFYDEIITQDIEFYKKEFVDLQC
ncbi:MULTISPECIES: hypothetical protein [Pasteurellaceae]|uniref:Uncharacterized protein n=1 Tax=Pasteurella atlantica TaxID=2827233 RepID=A0AAW8CSE4_9PAST|nr:hypothetical protein [Pasteurella atlantica]MBR0574440.1 hypothetical protein [Pasteurella atlantica]MDP8040321.1 hypothetical protein [Pasteurella atlantica]MDP8042495.1 hypothetical protein [Pasteurella atlantica]MDP8044591.1 hypothetical protein [Pasteurella atlantica]MDP8046662.1 hypothetical protein [Pasteurella atlantica]